MMMMNHFFHLVNYSPWPIIAALNLTSLGMSVVMLITQKIILPISMSIILLILVKFQWWRDVIRESMYEGTHSPMVNRGISMGVIFFIISELCFFVSFFWMYFYLSLSPDVTMGMMWPPQGTVPVDYLSIPLLNTLILLASGFFITLAHYSIMTNKFFMMKTSYLMAISLGIYFFMIQMYEYYELSFDISDSAFGSSFFILTGFHGLHVFVGILFITVNYMRILNKNFSSILNLGFEYSAWYWHFVDVIWLFLYLFIYWWGM